MLLQLEPWTFEPRTSEPFYYLYINIYIDIYILIDYISYREKNSGI
jgi:hypothetical protein